MHSGGYVVDYAPGHPLTTEKHPGYVYQHRRVFYDAHGAGPFRCHVCSASVTWADMDIDHLDDDKTNNAVANLAPACPVCNRRRGLHKMRAKRRQAGVLLSAFGRTMCLSEWATEVGISLPALRYRIDAGWALERALSEGRGRFGPRATSRG